MKGMTGFGRAKVDNKRYEVVAEISSVNKRHLDISLRLPREFQQIDSSLRRFLSSKVFRGQISISICVNPLEATVAASAIHWPKIEGQIVLLQQIAQRLGSTVPTEKAVFELWRRQLDSDSEREEMDPEIEGLILRAVEEAFSIFDKRRLAEGAFLAEDLRKRAQTLRTLKAEITQKLVGHIEQIQQRLTALVEKNVPSLAHDDRVLREVVLYADKADVSEELSRIDHHLDHVETILSENAVAGKLLEFVLQELQREFNTLGAKTAIAEVSTAVVIAKTELEKMREQVQNVE